MLADHLRLARTRLPRASHTRETTRPSSGPRLAARSLALLAALALPAHADDSFDPRDVDKQAHMATSYGIALTVAVIARHHDVPRWQAALLGAATALVLGTAKELADDPYSWGDQAANAIGAGTAAAVVFTFRL